MTEFNLPSTAELLEGMAQMQDQITKAREGDQAAIDFCLQMLEMMIMASTVTIDDPDHIELVKTHLSEITEVVGDHAPKFPPKNEGSE